MQADPRPELVVDPAMLAGGPDSDHEYEDEYEYEYDLAQTEARFPVALRGCSVPADDRGH